MAITVWTQRSVRENQKMVSLVGFSKHTSRGVHRMSTHWVLLGGTCRNRMATPSDSRPLKLQGQGEVLNCQGKINSHDRILYII